VADSRYVALVPREHVLPFAGTFAILLDQVFAILTLAMLAIGR
jgi:hypothetical protein